MKTNLLTVSSLALLSAMIMATGAQAQVLDEDEIIVTAQKKAENIQEVGVSVTTFSGDSAREFGFSDSTDIVAQVPGLNVGTPVGEGNNPSFVLRGVGLNDFNDNNEGPIAVYVDDVYQAALPGLTFQLFDTERVEVLRGPQGTLYGRNATGGLIHYISKKPTEEFEGFAEIEYGSYNTTNIDAALGGAIGEGVRTRLSLAYDSRDGYVENRIGPDANEAQTFALRGQLEFDLGSNTTINLKPFMSESKTNAPQYQHAAGLSNNPSAADNLPFCAADVARDLFCYADTDGDNFAGEYNNIGTLEIDSKGFHGTFNHEFGNGITLTNVFGIQNTEKTHQEDTDVGPLDATVADFSSEIDALTNEIRLAGDFEKGSWQLGGFYLDTKAVSSNGVRVNYRSDFIGFLDSPDSGAGFDGFLAATSVFDPTSPDLHPWLNFDVDYTQNTESWALFAQGDYDLTDSVKLTAGVRYTEEDRDFIYRNVAAPGPALNNALNAVGETNFFTIVPGETNGFANAFSGGALPLDTVPEGANELKDDNISGKVTLDWQATDDLLLFATASQGFKAGGFNAGFLDQTDFITSDQVKFDAETLKSYEAGLKWTSANRKLRLNASAFIYDYEDFQALTFQGLSQFIQNAEAKYYGGEAELGFRLNDRLDGQIGASILDTDVDGVVVQGVTLNDRESVLSPNFTTNGFVRYTQPVGNDSELTAVVSYNHQGEHFFDITNSPQSREGAYTLFDARLAYGPSNKNWEVAGFVKNLTDEEYRVYTFDFQGTLGLNQQFFGPPQWWGVSFRIQR